MDGRTKPATKKDRLLSSNQAPTYRLLRTAILTVRNARCGRTVDFFAKLRDSVQVRVVPP